MPSPASAPAAQSATGVTALADATFAVMVGVALGFFRGVVVLALRCRGEHDAVSHTRVAEVASVGHPHAVGFGAVLAVSWDTNATGGGSRLSVVERLAAASKIFGAAAATRFAVAVRACLPGFDVVHWFLRGRRNCAEISVSRVGSRGPVLVLRVTVLHLHLGSRTGTALGARLLAEAIIYTRIAEFERFELH